ncbi:MAG TPA: PepSY-associated TM helix domain-containing protein [Povalibacter sp.]|uniref:PepSY-associated TM helix domain-containing protein n=1 Tax=Povalibacter sp. TaxID=1962978 RepID=UPI002C535CF8|nr:PepSY-associated TM helix domain-containing protein [Povalibacter sp.]HMN43221.1 PepSY-associated TM helix domain-containing protein [Povalibacter sp.]
MTRSLWVLLHRWAGLSMAAFLIVVGLSGAVLAFYGDLDGYFAAELHRLPAARPGAEPLDPFSLRAMVAASRPEAAIDFVSLDPPDPRSALRFRVEGKIDPATGEPAVLPYTEFYVNPMTGDVTGDRRFGDLSQGMKNLMPFILDLHTSLVAGVVGQYALGIIALLWTVDCFVGAYLTLPRARPFFGKWAIAWQVKPRRLNYDLHRAGGLWLWIALFVFAWSSVYFNLNSLYTPVTQFLFGMRDDVYSTALPQAAEKIQLEPGIDWREAHRLLEPMALTESARHGVEIQRENWLSYDPRTVAYLYSVMVNDARAATGEDRELIVSMDANTGRLHGASLQQVEKPGDVITRWLGMLHVAGIWGLPYRIFVFITGLMIVVLSVTGVVIWWRKRRASSSSSSRRQGGKSCPQFNCR